MDWDRLRVFKAVADAGSFTGAMRSMHLSQSAISRNIGHLEDELGVKLFHRHPRGLLLTESGEILLSSVRHVFSELAMVQNSIAAKKQQASGTLKVTATVAFGTTWLAAEVKDFLATYPDINLELHLSDEEVNLGMREADIAIRMHKPSQHDLVYRPLVNFRLKIYAAQSYLEQYGEPKTVEELDNFQLILYDKNASLPLPEVNWLESLGKAQGEKRHGRLLINSLYGIYRAVRSGLGIASLPDYMVKDPANLALKQILPDIKGPKAMAYFVYPEELRHSRRLSVFRDFILQRVESLKETKTLAKTLDGSDG